MKRKNYLLRLDPDAHALIKSIAHIKRQTIAVSLEEAIRYYAENKGMGEIEGEADKRVDEIKHLFDVARKGGSDAP